MTARSADQRKAAIEKITSDWVAACEAVDAESAEQDARDKRRFSGEPPTAADKAYDEAFKAFVNLARTARLCVDEWEHFIESAGVSGLQHGIAHCREKIRQRDEQRKAAGLSPNTWAQVAGAPDSDDDLPPATAAEREEFDKKYAARQNAEMAARFVVINASYREKRGQ